MNFILSVIIMTNMAAVLQKSTSQLEFSVAHQFDFD